jgi:hypothetical protein
MEMLATIVLGVSVLGIASLFLIKNWEEKHARIFLPGVRLAADQGALTIKAFLIWGIEECRKLGPTTLRISRVVLHDLALSLAALSRASERAAHNLADMVSHKHHFERKETKNEFLKQVGEIPIRNLRDASPLPLAASPAVSTPDTQNPVATAETKPESSVAAAPEPSVAAKKGKNGKSAKGKGQPESKV